MTPHPYSIVIIGGGFSGTVTAMHLARHAQYGRLRVTLLDSDPTFGCGLAYRLDDDNLMLNVPAGNMSAFADEPDHFVSYCRTTDPSISACSFVSRRLYGHYLQGTLAQTQTQHSGVIETRVDKAVALHRRSDSATWQISLASGQPIHADHVVLATGHQAPVLPIPLHHAERAHIVDPWDFSAMHRFPKGQPVVILGTGHTAVDALFCLTQAQPQRQICMLSRHGLLPHGHRLNPLPPQSHDLPQYLCDLPPTIRHYAQALRRHLRTPDAQGLDWRDVLNALRPHTPQLWQSLPPVEQKRFLRHLQSWWDVHRHRLAPVVAQRLNILLASGRVQTMAARLLSVQNKQNGVEVRLRHRGSGQHETIRACALINCTGPNTDLRHGANPLLTQLLQAGVIRADAHGLGLLVAPNYQLLAANHKAVDGLWYVGPMLKAQLWEATAVPELRVHAQQLAHTLLIHTLPHSAARTNP
jgi:uncharacterized NAD(P)/FAD-binding protein YdhS